MQYRIDDEGTIFHLEWNNPFTGDNESLCRVEGTHADFYITAYVTGSGNTKAPMRFMLGEKADASPRQRDWRTCKNCKGLFFALDDGHCAAHPLGIVSAPSPETIEQAQSPLPPGLTTRRPEASGSTVAKRPLPRRRPRHRPHPVTQQRPVCSCSANMKPQAMNSTSPMAFPGRTVSRNGAHVNTARACSTMDRMRKAFVQAAGAATRQRPRGRTFIYGSACLP